MPRPSLLLLAAGLSGLATAPALPSEARRTPAVIAVERVAPAVVNVSTEQLVARREEPTAAADPFLEEIFDDVEGPTLRESFERASLGSGILIDARGHVLTNAHVVERASRIRISLSDRREFDAELVGTDPSSDVAVLRARTSERLPFVPLGTSDDLRIGETLLAIGNPFGLSHTVTMGVLSAKGRTVRAGKRSFADFLQTDAAINPGNSGGPIVNLDGQVVGIATAIYRSGPGIGFAIPIDRAARVVASLVSHGTAQSAWIGLEAKPADAAAIAALRLPGPGALVVTRVVAGGPAEDARVSAGDILVAVGEGPVATVAELDAALARAAPSAPVRLDLVRDGRRTTASVRPLTPGSARVPRIAAALLGMEVARPEAGAGVVIARVVTGGLAAARGFAAGDMLHEMDGIKLDAPETYHRAFYAALSKGSTMLLVQHGESAYYVPLVFE